MSEQETIEVEQDIDAPRRVAPVEYVGRLRRWQTGLHIDVSSMVASVKAGDVLMVRPDLTPGSRWRTGRTTVRVHVFDVEWSRITAVCDGDYVYRIGAPLTPSLDERVTAIERLLGLVADDLEVAVDAELAGQRDEAAQLRLRALARIRETAQWGRTST